MLTACERTLHKHSRRALVCFMIALHDLRYASTSESCAAYRRSFSALMHKHAHVIILANQAQPAGHPYFTLARARVRAHCTAYWGSMQCVSASDLTSLILSYGVELSRGAPMGLRAWRLARAPTFIPSAVGIASCGSSGVEALCFFGRSRHGFVQFLGPIHWPRRRCSRHRVCAVPRRRRSREQSLRSSEPRCSFFFLAV